MNNSFYLELKQNFKNKNFDIKSYERIFDEYLKQVNCTAIKCDKLCQIRKSIAYVLNKHKRETQIKKRNEEIFYQILHDIKSPALGIKFALEGINRSELEEEIYTINLNTLELIQSFLSIYSFEKGAKRITYEQFCLKELVKRELDIYKYLFKSNNLKVCFKCYYSGNIASEKNIIRRILSNLITNAVKYAKDNSEIIIEVKKCDRYIILCTSNLVKNLDVDAACNLFKKFNTDGADDSFGLGLFICRRLAKSINSKINAKHKDGCITFELKIPKA